MNKRALYESIMKRVAKEVKKALNEVELTKHTNYSEEDVKDFAENYLISYYIDYKISDVDEFPNWGELLEENPEFSTRKAHELLKLFMDGNSLEAKYADEMYEFFKEHFDEYATH